jgi:hypothetical protein
MLLYEYIPFYKLDNKRSEYSSRDMARGGRSYPEEIQHTKLILYWLEEWWINAGCHCWNDLESFDDLSINWIIRSHYFNHKLSMCISLKLHSKSRSAPCLFYKKYEFIVIKCYYFYWFLMSLWVFFPFCIMLLVNGFSYLEIVNIDASF